MSYLKIWVLVLIYVYICVGLCTHMWVPSEVRRGHLIPQNLRYRRCELPEVGAGNET